MKRLLKNRFSILVIMILFFIAVNFATRIVLMAVALGQVNLNIITILKTFGIALFYDFVTSTYFFIPLAIYLSIVPQKIFKSKINRIFVFAIMFINIYLIIFTSFSEWFFWDEFGKRFNFIAVDYLVYTHEVINNILESYPIPLLLSIILLISIGVFYFIYKKTDGFDEAFSSKEPLISRFAIGVFFLMLPVLFFNVLNKQSLSSVSEDQYNNELAKNGVYSLFSAFRNNTLDYDEFYRTKPIDVVMSNLYKLVGFNDKHTKFIKKTGPEKRYNVILIMVESLSAEYMGIFGDTKNLTPHLDNLTKKSLFFDHFYATGTRTVRGMEAVTMSVPPTPGRSIIKRPDCHNMFSVGFIFNQKGYENKFIYAGEGYFDNMNDYFSHNGFDIVDRLNFSSDEITFSNVWGVCDEDLLNKVLKESDKTYKSGKPFFNFVMTTSNHRPYTYPDGKIDIPSHTGRIGGVKYTDFAINQFIKKAKNKPWFKNTIFIILADHNGGSAGKTSLPAWRYKIPLIIYAPHIIKPQTVSKLSSQVDLMPTLFSIMNWSYKSKFYGDDILSSAFKERAFIGNYQKLGLLRDKKLTILTPDKKVREYLIVDQKLRSVKYKDIKPLDKNVLDIITYYQSASYFYKHKLDRWDSSQK
jgi:phosphoglycerol transferase MdoB-like AlkP superfamily enzyme